MARRFTAADGWKEGDPAPADAFRALDENREPVGPVLHTHPGEARQIVAQGESLTAEALAELRSAPAPEAEEQPAPSSDAEKG
ncbi:hypothetical protein [Streptomyces sp. NPDC004135]